ncbi:hypothetical protein niasHT_024149 [Heterodera trifolii]|uniref:Uncharacterized protein n=1 Tax=Heterodera trifolii TaxID=157864 RepID=A0ABD2JLZ0_9BILA
MYNLKHLGQINQLPPPAHSPSVHSWEKSPELGGRREERRIGREKSRDKLFWWSRPKAPKGTAGATMDGGDDHIAREEIVPMAMDDKFGSTRQTPGGGGRNGSDRRATEQRMEGFEMVSDTSQTVLWMIHSLAGEFIRRAEGRGGGGTLGHRSFRDQISLPAVLHQNHSPHPSSPPPLIPIFPTRLPLQSRLSPKFALSLFPIWRKAAGWGWTAQPPPPAHLRSLRWLSPIHRMHNPTHGRNFREEAEWVDIPKTENEVRRTRANCREMETKNEVGMSVSGNDEIGDGKLGGGRWNVLKFI